MSVKSFSRAILWLLAVVIALIGRSTPVHAQSAAPLLFRQPALSATDICFTFAGDIWVVPRAGGAARRLTASAGSETGCRFSPDGKWVAYTSTANGNADVYTIGANGGVPRRLTWHPGSDVVRGWTPDGK